MDNKIEQEEIVRLIDENERKSKYRLVFWLVLTLILGALTVYYGYQSQEKSKDLDLKNQELLSINEQLQRSQDSILLLNENLIASKDTLNRMRDSLTTVLKKINNIGFTKNKDVALGIDLEQLILRSEVLGLEELIKKFEISIYYQGGQDLNAKKISNGLKSKGFVHVVERPVQEISSTYSNYSIVTSNEIDKKLAQLIIADLSQ
ncbi:MAG: hypothetical protein F6K19_49295, partial [Cyanothece sp. SIO1E1]|nr:hypothetical protein [Cyanothece sp. SIO1E1]